MIIALMGNDGSGKTTIAKNLEKIFKDLGFEVIYKHEYQYTILKYLFKIIGTEKVEAERKKMLIERRKCWKFYLWPFLVWIDGILTYTYYKIFKRKVIVILDRYLLDHYMSFKYLGYITKFSEWLYLHSPKPDVGIILWVEPKIAYERKKNTHGYSIEFYKTQTERYLQLAHKLRLPTINTNKSIEATIKEILDIVHEKEPVRREVIKRGLQNKTFFEVLEKYKDSLMYKTLNKQFETRVKKFISTTKFLKKLFSRIGINEYIIFKDYGNSKWIGNDVDVIISEKDFDKLIRFLRYNNDIELDGVTYKLVFKINKSHTAETVDLIVDNLLPIDIHTAIEWRGINILKFEDLRKYAIIKRKFGTKYFGLQADVDALIFAFTHIFEKGYITLLEFRIVRENIKSLFALINDSKVFCMIKRYLAWLEGVSIKEFPLFIPISIIISIFKEYTKCVNRNTVRLTNTFLKIILLQIFWRLRYRVKSILPFEIGDYKVV